MAEVNSEVIPAIVVEILLMSKYEVVLAILVLVAVPMTLDL